MKFTTIMVTYKILSSSHSVQEFLFTKVAINNFPYLKMALFPQNQWNTNKKLPYTLRYKLLTNYMQRATSGTFTWRKYCTRCTRIDLARYHVEETGLTLRAALKTLSLITNRHTPTTPWEKCWQVRNTPAAHAQS